MTIHPTPETFFKNQEKEQLIMLLDLQESLKWLIEDVRQTWRLWMRPSRDLIFRCGQREIPNSLHFLLRTVRPTFKFFEASIIGRSKYFERSSSVSLDISLVVARFCFLSAKPTIFHHSVWLINFKQEKFTRRYTKRIFQILYSQPLMLHPLAHLTSIHSIIAEQVRTNIRNSNSITEPMTTWTY